MWIGAPPHLPFKQLANLPWLLLFLCRVSCMARDKQRTVACFALSLVCVLRSTCLGIHDSSSESTMADSFPWYLLNFTQSILCLNWYCSCRQQSRWPLIFATNCYCSLQPPWAWDLSANSKLGIPFWLWQNAGPQPPESPSQGREGSSLASVTLLSLMRVS